MLANAGIACDYFFKKYPRNFFTWMGILTEGAQQWGHLSGKALAVAKNISRMANFFQIGCDIPSAFQSFRVIYEKYQGYETKLPSEKPGIQVPLWVETCRSVSSAAFLTGFSRHHLFDQPRSPLIELIGTVAELFEKSYDFYSFINQWQEKSAETSKLTIRPPSEDDFSLEEKSFFHKISLLSWDIQNIAQLVHKVSNIVLVALSLITLSQGVDDCSPNLTIFFTTTSLSSHFIFYYNSHINLKIRTNYH